MKMRKLMVIAAGALVFAFAQAANADCGKCGADDKHKGKHGKKAEHKDADHKASECESGECEAHMDKAKHKGAKKSKESAHAGNKAEITVPVLARMLKANAVPILLDARGGKYDDGRRIPGAKQLTPDASKKEIAKMIPAKDTLVVAYCANPQCPASSKLNERLQELGYKNVLELPAGIEGWAEAGHEIEEAE